MARTKMDVLVERLADAANEMQRLSDQIVGLCNTSCDLTCSGCGQHFDNEGQFASHYLIPDERYLNLGYCPVKDQTNV